MDFLDPRRKKAHRRRLLAGYLLMAVAVAMGTLILLFMAYGYDVDRKTGTVIQNGVVYVDSKPGGANISVNGVTQRNKTGSRLALPAGQYTVTLTHDGFRPWLRTFTLDGGQIEQMVYPFMIPQSLKSTDVQLYASDPGYGSQSPDRKWLLVQQPGQTYSFDMYDTTNPGNNPVNITVPKGALTDPDTPATLTVLEWSNDNRHVLFDRTYANKHEFLVLDREAPNDTVNLNKYLGVSPSSVTLKNKKPDQFYLYNSAGGELRSADSKSKTITAPLLKNVINYKSYNDNIVLFATQEGAPSDKMFFKILQDDKVYTLSTNPASNNYLMNIIQTNGHWYYAVGSGNQGAVLVFRDPIDVLRITATGKQPQLSIAAVLRVNDPRFVTISANTQFISVQGGSTFAVYDTLNDRQQRATLKNKVPDGQKMTWMDGNRLSYVADKSVYVVDFDGSNEQKLVAVNGVTSGPYFDRDYDNVFTIAPSVSVDKRAAITQTALTIK